MTYYDAQAGIVYVELLDTEVARSVEHDWGLIDLDHDGKPVGLEYWHASERLPGELFGGAARTGSCLGDVVGELSGSA